MGQWHYPDANVLFSGKRKNDPEVIQRSGGYHCHDGPIKSIELHLGFTEWQQFRDFRGLGCYCPESGG